MQCRGHAGWSDPPSRLKHLFPQLLGALLAAADGLWELLSPNVMLPSQEQPVSKDWLTQGYVCPTLTSLTLSKSERSSQLQSFLWGHWHLCWDCLIFSFSLCLILLAFLPLQVLTLKRLPNKRSACYLPICTLTKEPNLQRWAGGVVQESRGWKRDFGAASHASQLVMRTAFLVVEGARTSLHKIAGQLWKLLPVVNWKMATW